MKISVKKLKEQLSGLSTKHALTLLSLQYKRGGAVLFFNGERYTVDSALIDLPEYLLEIRCGGFGAIQFYGGPPNKGTWYPGTILTLLCDAILYEEFSDNIIDVPLCEL
jgi:hypothetical protein